MPRGSVAATLFKLAVTVTDGPPGVSEPPAGATFSQAQVLTSVQPNEFVPILVSARLCEMMSNGPPTGPRLVKPARGRICNVSGTSNASTTPAVVKLEGEVAL